MSQSRRPQKAPDSSDPIEESAVNPAPGILANSEATSKVDQTKNDGRVAPAEAATRLFLEDFQRRIEASAAEARTEAGTLHRRETAVFSAHIFTGVLSLTIIVTGFVLIVTHLMTYAVLAETIGLICGAGSMSFRKAAVSTAERRRDLSKSEAEDANLLKAIGVTLMIPDDDERNAAMVNLAGRLAERIGPIGSDSRPRHRK